MVASFLEHLKLVCWWDIPGTVLLIVAIAYVIISRKKLKKELKELEE